MNTPIAQLLARKGSSVFSVAMTASVADAVRVMNLNHIGSIVVMRAGRLAGIFTERDVLTRVVASGRAPDFTSVADVMTAKPITVAPHTTVEEVMALFTEKRVRHIPVIGEEDALVGLISIGDVTRWMVDSHRSEAEHLRQYISGSY